MRRLGAWVTMLALCTGGARAQEELQPGRAREELVKVIDAYVISNLQESLDLTDEQFVKLLPLVKKWQAGRRAHQQRRIATILEMRRLFEGGSATETRLAELLRELKQAEAEEQATERRDLDAIDAQLSVVQQAKLRVFEARVQQRLREILERRREQGPRGRERP